MTTKVLVICPNVHEVRVTTEDRVWDAEKQTLGDFRKTDEIMVAKGSYADLYVTDTRRLIIEEIPSKH